MREKDPSERTVYDTFHYAYAHLPSKDIRRMLGVDDGSRPDRTAALKNLWASYRLQRIRLGRGVYIERPL